jgi:hypothetical protein
MIWFQQMKLFRKRKKQRVRHVVKQKKGAGQQKEISALTKWNFEALCSDGQ